MRRRVGVDRVECRIDLMLINLTCQFESGHNNDNNAPLPTPCSPALIFNYYYYYLNIVIKFDAKC